MNYLFVYDPTQLNFNAEEIHSTITAHLGVNDWWHYLSNVYIVTTETSEQHIADKIIARHPGLRFLVIAVDLRKYNGVLSKNAWEWISKKNRITLKVKSVPQPQKSLYDILGIPSSTTLSTSESSKVKSSLETLLGLVSSDKK